MRLLSRGPENVVLTTDSHNRQIHISAAPMLSPTSSAANLRRALGNRPIVMVGMMGCGKTSIGRRLANVLELKFIDADDEIEKAAGMTINEIFAELGETHFRDGERRVIARLLAGGAQILATGGGAFMCEATRRAIKTGAISVWLKADLPVLMKRVMRRDHRPLLKTNDPEARMRELLVARSPIYAEADITVHSRDVSHDEIMTEILEKLAAGPLAPALAALSAAAPGKQKGSRLKS